MSEDSVPLCIISPTKSIHGTVLKHYENVLKKEFEALSIRERYIHISQPRFSTVKSNGDKIIFQLRATLDSFGVTRHFLQVRFHEKFILSCLPKIYEDEWAENSDEILKRHNIENVKCESLVMTPRRFGKTWSVAMFCAAFVYCVPKCEISVYSTGKRMAAKLMDLCCDFLFRLSGAAEMIRAGGRRNQEKVVLKGPYGGQDKRVLCCYPGTVKVYYTTLFFSFFKKGPGTPLFFLVSIFFVIMIGCTT